MKMEILFRKKKRGIDQLEVEEHQEQEEDLEVVFVVDIEVEVVLEEEEDIEEALEVDIEAREVEFNSKKALGEAIHKEEIGQGQEN